MNKKTIKKIYCFGNEDIKEDAVALELADLLNKDSDMKDKNIEFIKCTNPDIFLSKDAENKNIIIIDVVKGIDDIKVIKDINELKNTKISTMHDFDLGTVLKLLKEVGKINEVRIIGIPYGKKVNEIDVRRLKINLSQYLIPKNENCS
ncbi:MAG: hypothetical protein ABIG89_06065 [Candidatus Woesearchaeota archaeon]